MTRLLRLGLPLALLLVGCPGIPTVKLQPIPRPPGVVAQVEADVERTALALNGAMLTLSIVKAGTEERLTNVTVSLVGPTLGAATIERGNAVSFTPLIPGSYQLRVSAPGYKTLVEGNITLESKQTLERKIELEPEGGTITGRVLSGGQAVWGARVRLGDVWAFTEKDGSFTISGAGAGAGTLSVRKGGYAGHDQAVTVKGATSVGDLNLGALGGKRAVMLVNASESFGGGVKTVGSELMALRDAVSATSTLSWTGTPAEANVRIYASPKVAGDVAELQGFVSGGGTLVITGEWGGFGDYDSAAVNAMARPFGLAVRPDLVRMAGQAQSEWITASPNPAMAPSQGVSALKLYTSASVMALPMAVKLAGTGANGYRVQAVNNGDQTLAAAVPYGDGLVVLVGDTSAWTGTHLGEGGNRQFMLNLFGW